ncbi:manganese efflux pump MntP family protein [Alicyclobacillus macrosporangiidus]|uniref:Putative Mn2+ efflux pump MntP n=1 Tax=Alicyclobacillus macrosporangiidus TaxID=392015 RepID=A0A1I7HUF6_9BACL|nr:manganese efflux pump [Alicyclobacillus macrosporangiidus]SFU64372.1 Putative Mn2+ efflux pump MntP [Alicyclobacillus macrosporangiidus]
MADHIHDLFEILMMSMALGMDAFSLSIGIGLHGIRRQAALRLAGTIGVFHVLMTLTGLYIGLAMQGLLGAVAQGFGALLLCGMGLHMLYTSVFAPQQVAMTGTGGIALLAFSASVSIDALSVGFSLGLRSTAYGLVSAGAFGIAGGILCLAGLYIGGKAGGHIGRIGELAGALILFGYGVHLLAG